jgi:hypothetical protein
VNFSRVVTFCCSAPDAVEDVVVVVVVVVAGGGVEDWARIWTLRAPKMQRKAWPFRTSFLVLMYIYFLWCLRL